MSSRWGPTFPSANRVDRAYSVGLGRQPFQYPIILPTGHCVSHDDARRAAATLGFTFGLPGCSVAFFFIRKESLVILVNRNFVLSEVTGGPDALLVAFGTNVSLLFWNEYSVISCFVELLTISLELCPS